MLGGRFSIVTVLDSVVGLFEDLAKKYGINEHLASIRWIDIPVLDIHCCKRKTGARIITSCEEDTARQQEGFIFVYNDQPKGYMSAVTKIRNQSGISHCVKGSSDPALRSHSKKMCTWSLWQYSQWKPVIVF